MKKLNSFWVSCLLLCGFAIGMAACAPTQQAASSAPVFKFAGSIYVGWMPWFLASSNGALHQNAQEQGIDIQFIQGDYIETINQFVAGGVDAVLVTNVDALALLVGSGIETDVILIGSYSHGNDAILLRPNQSLEQENLRLGLVEFSVSHYLMNRFQAIHPENSAKISYVNISDAEIPGAFAATSSNIDGVVSWNPMVLQIEQTMGGQNVFDSRSIEREIADMLVVRRAVLDQHPEFAQALLNTWFDMMGAMNGSEKEAVLESLGKLSGTDQPGYLAQLQTTLLMDTPEKAQQAIRDDTMRQTMEHVRAFVKSHDLVTFSGPNAPTQETWVSYPADQSKGPIHFNSQPLEFFCESGGCKVNP